MGPKLNGIGNIQILVHICMKLLSSPLIFCQSVPVDRGRSNRDRCHRLLHENTPCKLVRLRMFVFSFLLPVKCWREIANKLLQIQMSDNAMEAGKGDLIAHE